METYHLPPVFREHVFWHERNPLELQGDRFANREAAYFRNMMPWQLELVKEVHLFTQMYWLEGNLVNICKKNLPVGVEKIKISIRRGDWWWSMHPPWFGIWILLMRR
jgi:hypothetical protein